MKIDLEEAKKIMNHDLEYIIKLPYKGASYISVRGCMNDLISEVSRLRKLAEAQGN